MSDLRRNVDELTRTLALWTARDNGKPQPEIRAAANDAITAIDSMLSELHGIRQELLSEMRRHDDIAAARVDALLAKLRAGGR